MTTPIERISTLTIGSVESVDPTEINVLLDLDAPQAIALNTGVPLGFPRINSYLLIPNETGAVVGMVVWIGIEKSPFPKRTGLKDFDLIDLPYPLRKLKLTPLGTLVSQNLNQKTVFKLERGVAVFPSVGDQVLLPTANQLKAIIEKRDENSRVVIGTSPFAAGAEVSIDPDKLFGRHLAVLGNTGSGKSCTVAGLIRWSIEKSKEIINEILSNDIEESDKVQPNTRFILLDPNGEYSSTFNDLCGNVNLFQVNPTVEYAKDLVIPAWMWNSEEWCAFTQATLKTQKPLLLNALRDLKSGTSIDDTKSIQFANYIKGFRNNLIDVISSGPTKYERFPNYKNICITFEHLQNDCYRYLSCFSGELQRSIASLIEETKKLVSKRKVNDHYSPFSESDLINIKSYLDKVIQNIPCQDLSTLSNEDSPIKFDIQKLPDHIEMLSVLEQSSQYISTLKMRIRNIFSDQRLRNIIYPDDTNQPDIKDLIEDYLAITIKNEKKYYPHNKQITIIDLSLVPSDVVHVIISVIARIIFESLQRYRKFNQKELPTVLVLEEAHTFIHKDVEKSGETITPSEMCRNTFEKIAREGRKFGLGLVLSSQRPSELSPTVLSQCNTFILHRIVNDRDQDLVRHLVPDNLGGLLKDLPNLPSQQAIILGAASSIPTLVEINELPEEHRPRSNDPQFWKVWTREEGRPNNWKDIVKDWTNEVSEEDSNEEQNSVDTDSDNDLPF